MKAYQWILLSIFGFLTLALVIGASALMGYYYSTTSVEPQVIVETVVVEKPVEVVVTKEVIKEILITPTPTEIVVPTATPEPLAVFPTEEPEVLCEDAAWVVLQPNSDELKVGQIERLHFRIRNDGDCIWDEYVLSSDGTLPDIPVPLTYPSEVADIVYDFLVTNSFEVRWHLQAPTTGLLLLSNSASPGTGLETIYYELKAKEKTFNYICGPFGCKLYKGWKYK